MYTRELFLLANVTTSCIGKLTTVLKLFCLSIFTLPFEKVDVLLSSGDWRQVDRAAQYRTERQYYVLNWPPVREYRMNLNVAAHINFGVNSVILNLNLFHRLKKKFKYFIAKSKQTNTIVE